MRPLLTRKVDIYFSGIRLSLEIEEYRTLYHVHFIDYRKYFCHLDTVTFKKSQISRIFDIVETCYKYALEKHYF